MGLKLQTKTLLTLDIFKLSFILFGLFGVVGQLSGCFPLQQLPYRHIAVDSLEVSVVSQQVVCHIFCDLLLDVRMAIFRLLCVSIPLLIALLIQLFFQLFYSFCR